jgi:beta-galactosidase/beta-glucuronidase
MALADRLGVLIIDRSRREPQLRGRRGTGGKASCAVHDAAAELVTRDKNHPSVILWCVANGHGGQPVSPAPRPEVVEAGAPSSPMLEARRLNDAR